ncbi:MAG TPA: fatty acid desaturase, partial [Thermoanaerobaculia bacterium]
MTATYYADHTRALRHELGNAIPVDELRRLHRRRPVLHFLVVLGLLAVLAGATTAIALLDPWYFWLPFAVVSGFAIFNFTVLLHEVVHRTVLTQQREGINRLLGILYAVPSGISATQFTRWHLDHHAALGSELDDPKRHHLSPKRNERWFKLLYFTPALFAIYFRAAKREAETYSSELQRAIRLERNLTIVFHLALLGAISYFAGFPIAWKAYVVPYFLVFPFAFALNRVGQHYDIDPADPAKWSTLVKGSWFWDLVYLCSNYHLEHHYFPSVPLYNLPRLQRVLRPFYERH